MGKVETNHLSLWKKGKLYRRAYIQVTDLLSLQCTLSWIQALASYVSCYIFQIALKFSW